MVLEILQSVVREGEKKRGKGRGIQCMLQREQCILIQLLNHVLPFFCAYNGRGEDRISAKKYKMLVYINYNISNTKGSSFETKAT